MIIIFEYFAGALTRASLIVSKKVSMFPNRKLNDLLAMNNEMQLTKRMSSMYASSIPNAPNDIETNKNPADSFMATPIESIINTVFESEIPNRPKRATNPSEENISSPMDIHANPFIESS